MTGIENIIKLIDEKTDEREKEILGEAERHKKLKLQEAERRAKEAVHKITKKAESDLKTQMARYEAGTKLKSKYQILEAKDGLIESVLEEAKQSLEQLVGRAEYKRVLNKLAIDAGVALGAEDIELLLAKGHEEYVDITMVQREVAKKAGKKARVTISKQNLRTTGGVMARTRDTTKWVDNTFEARFERMSGKIRDKTASILFGSGEEK